MGHWTWFERHFTFDYPASKFPDLLERLRGTPARVEELLRGVSADVLTRRDGETWSIQENVGHLIDLGYLPRERLEQILSGADTLLAADVTNRRTNERDHNRREIGELLREFRKERAALVARLEGLPEETWGKGARHPRLDQPMRVVDIVCFDSEHDDYHLARMRALLRHFGGQ